MKIHVQHVTNLKQKLYGYDIDPFSNDAPRHLPTGKVTEAIIFFDIIRASELGLSQYKAFKWQTYQRDSKFLHPIKKNINSWNK